MGSAILNDADWSRFLVSYFEEIYRFINGGRVNDSVYEYYKKNRPTWTLPEELKISKTEAYNAAKTFKDKIGELNSLINNIIQCDDLTTATIKDAYGAAETVLLNIVHWDMKLNPDDIKSNEGTFYKCCLRLSNHILGNGYPIKTFEVKVKEKDGSERVSERVSLPFWTVKDIRNKLHPEKGETRYTTPEIKGQQQGMELGKFLLFSLIQIIALGHKMGTLKKPVGETVTLDIPYEFSYVKYKTGGNREGRIERNGDKPYNLEIADIYRYEGIDIEVFITDENSIRFNTIQLDCSHLDNVKIRLGNKPMEYEIESTPKETVPLTLKTDLDCNMELAGMAKLVERGKEVKVDVSKGAHTITLASTRNPRYKMTREIDITEETVINDMLFARELHNHREWMDVNNIVVLKKGNYPWSYVLWDGTVDLPVSTIEGPSGSYEILRTGFAGNLFYKLVRYRKPCKEEYVYYNLDGNLIGYSGDMFTFEKGYEFIGKDDKGTALIIDKDGKRLFTIFDGDKWEPGLEKHYYYFPKVFEFSEDGYAAVIESDGTTIRFITDKWRTASNSYSYVPDNYPIFRNKYCAVKKTDGNYVIITNSNGYIKELPEKYEYLKPTKIQGRWYYLAKKSGMYGLLSPVPDAVEIPLEYDEIDDRALEYGIFAGKKDGQWTILEWAGISRLLPPPYDVIDVFSAKYFLVEKKADNGIIVRYLCTMGKILANDVKTGIYLSDHFVAAKHSDNRWVVYDIEGNIHLEGSDLRFVDPFLRIEKDGMYEMWKMDGSSLHKLGEGQERPEWSGNLCCFGKPKSDRKVYMNLKTGEKAVKYLGKWVWESHQHIAFAGSPQLGLMDEPPLVPFKRFSDPENVGLMKRDTFDEVVAPVYQSIIRAGNLWIAEDRKGKTLISDSGEKLAENLDYDYIRYYINDLYLAEKDGDMRLINAKGKPKSEFYAEIKPASYGYAAVRRYHWGFIRIEKNTVKVVSEPEYYAVKDYGEEKYAMVQKDDSGDWGLIDEDGNLVLECRYEDIEPFRCGFTCALKDGYWSIINKRGQEVITKKLYWDRCIYSKTRINENDFFFIDE